MIHDTSTEHHFIGGATARIAPLIEETLDTKFPLVDKEHSLGYAEEPSLGYTKEPVREEIPDTTFPLVDKDHLLEYIKAYVRDVGLTNHQIGSFNELVAGKGIKNILKNFFRSTRDIPSKDSSIYSSIHIDIQFTDVRFEMPYKVAKVSEARVSTTKKIPIFPSMIRQNGSSYEADMFFDIKITLTPTLLSTG